MHKNDNINISTSCPNSPQQSMQKHVFGLNILLFGNMIDVDTYWVAQYHNNECDIQIP